jgi:hypothetical protein
MYIIDYVIIFCSLVLIATMAVGVLEFIGWIVRKRKPKGMSSYKRRTTDKP